MSLAQARLAVTARLRVRREEIEQATMARVYGVAEPARTVEPEYVHGLRAAVSGALDYGLEVIESGEGHTPPVPTSLLAQARLAARNGVPLDTVLRRYFSGFTLFMDFVLQEAEGEVPLHGTSLHRFLQAQTAQLDNLISVVSEEYRRESEQRLGGDERRVTWVKRLLAGEPLDASDLGSELEGWHVALIVEGENCADDLQVIARALDRRLFLVRPRQGVAWAWLTGRSKIESAAVTCQLRSGLRPGVGVAIGEPGRGLPGWRLSHRQAKTVIPMARSRDDGVVCYADVGLLASVLQDEVLVTSLREQYLAPLEEGRDGGRALLETLHAYFASSRNITSTAARLQGSRQTVRTRLRIVEEKIGRLLDECAPEMELALRLDSLAD